MTEEIYAQGFKNRPYWWDAADRLDTLAEEPETLPAKVEIAVVGGGYTGMSAALTLARAGREVVVLDSGHPGYGCSARNGGLLGPSFHKLGMKGLAAAYGEDKAMAIVRAHGESGRRVHHTRRSTAAGTIPDASRVPTHRAITRNWRAKSIT